MFLSGDTYGKNQALDPESGSRYIGCQYGCCMLLGSKTVMQGECTGDEFGGFTAWVWDMLEGSQK